MHAKTTEDYILWQRCWTHRSTSPPKVNSYGRAVEAQPAGKLYGQQVGRPMANSAIRPQTPADTEVCACKTVAGQLRRFAATRPAI
jgi:hypothetical protein